MRRGALLAFLVRAVLIGAGVALAAVGLLQLLHSGSHEAAEPPPLVHWLRDGGLAAPLGVLSVVLAGWGPVHRSGRRLLRVGSGDLALRRATWALTVSILFALGTIPAGEAHARLFEAEHVSASWLGHALADGSVALLGAFVFMVAVALPLLHAIDHIGRTPRAVPAPRPRRQALHVPVRRRTAVGLWSLTVVAASLVPALLTASPAQSEDTLCTDANTVTADVVALDQPFFYNRLGADNPDGMIFALRHDVVSTTSSIELAPGKVRLREDKRPRPLVLRVNVGQCLEISFQNLLDPVARGDQPADRHVGMHVKGVAAVGGIGSDGSNAGENAVSGLADVGERRTYTLLAEHENAYLIENLGVTVGAEGGGGTTGFGLFGALNVEPAGSEWYRSQLTRVEMDLAAAAWRQDPATGNWEATSEPQMDAGGLAVRLDGAGRPVLNYDAVYPTEKSTPGYDARKAGQPIIAMRQGRTLAHSDLNAIITGPRRGLIPEAAYPDGYRANGAYRETAQQPFREFTAVFHDEIKARQAFDLFGKQPLSHTLHGVRDGFAINYGAGGAGAEVISNRLGVGPMWDCNDCKYEEFFLTSWAVGDPAMVVDIPANSASRTSYQRAATTAQVARGAKATTALYPDDPSNVHHSYLNDRVKIRNVHAGPKEHHVFHLHAHQWQNTPNDQNSSYLDSQLIGPGSGFTYDIAYGGSGNRNKTPGDSIFHCHFYPHFAQGMWELWRVHDTFERGTVLDVDGRPRPGARALPDGEIPSGTPVPALVPIPSLPPAPMSTVDDTVTPFDLNGDAVVDSSQLDLDNDATADFVERNATTGKAFAADVSDNPGFPFFVPGVAGHRPPTAPLDLKDDGGLPRHVLMAPASAAERAALGPLAESFETRLDMNKTLLKAEPVYMAESGTPAERAAMAAHGTKAAPGEFQVNGLAPVPGAPFANPCRSDSVTALPVTRTYRTAVIQLDAKFNKLGWHFPQQRIQALWGDVGRTLNGTRAPEPLVMRLGTDDCAEVFHTNLAPHVYELDDYQVRTPTDIIGQHIHLVKFDVLSADGSANGFNYEDGTFSPGEVAERVHAIRDTTAARGTDCATVNGANLRADLAGEAGTPACPLLTRHPYFGNVAGVGDAAWGARTTIQRWYADPLLNQSWDKGLGAVFTHDHFGPSTHQQTGLYSTVLVEPGGSTWRDPETGVVMGNRTVVVGGSAVPDGGPTSWRADILTADPSNAHREFYLEYGDFQHAYQAGGGKLTTQNNGAGVIIPSYADFKNAINPSFRQEPPSGHKNDLMWFPPTCPGNVPRPCPEAISADDVGSYMVNYRNEPIAARVYNPATKKQATGDRGDLALAFQSRTDRAIAALNTQPTFYPPLTKDIGPGDPYTPLLRAYSGDKVRIRAQVGATEEQHNTMIHGVKWHQEHLYDNSGWRNSQAGGISEYFVLDLPVLPDIGPGTPAAVDYFYTTGAGSEDLWNGNWGLLRSYAKGRTDLRKLPSNPIPNTGWKLSNEAQFDQTCPTTAPRKTYQITAVQASQVLGAGGLVYNDRARGLGPLVDRSALIYVNTADLVRAADGTPTGLKPGTPIEPVVIRANAGDCLKVRLTNALPRTVPNDAGFNALPPIMHQDENVNGGITTFNANDISPSRRVGLHTQLLEYDLRKADGFVAGNNDPGQTVAPGTDETYTWYAGEVTTTPDPAAPATNLRLSARPVEFGAVNLMPADRLKAASKGLVGALVVEPKGSTVVPDAGTRLAARVTGPVAFREVVTVLQDSLNLRYGSTCGPPEVDASCAVGNIAGEGNGFPEDVEDSGQKAINYRSDPLWYRLGMRPETPFETVASTQNAHRVFSNALVGGDPRVPVFTASPGEQVRFRLLHPGGHARGSVFTVHGHQWQRAPYTNGSDSIGLNPASWWTDSVEGVAASSHFDVVLPEAGGRARTAGDYLFRDEASFGSYQGLWGILRVK